MGRRPRCPKESSLASNSLWMLAGNSLRLIIQAAYFVIIARSLEPQEYGAFVAVVALAAVLSPFVGLGTSNLIFRDVALNEEAFGVSWGNALLTTLVTGLIALGLVSICRFALPENIHWTVLFFVAIADLICGRIIDLCGFAFGAKGQFSATAQINVWIGITRLLGLSILVSCLHHPSVEQWAITYLITTLVTSIASLAWALAALGSPSLNFQRLFKQIPDGFFFSVGQSAQSVYNDIDKTMLAKLGSLQSTGVYGAAYRLIDVSIVPLRSVLSAAYPGFFSSGRGRDARLPNPH